MKRFVRLGVTGVLLFGFAILANATSLQDHTKLKAEKKVQSDAVQNASVAVPGPYRSISELDEPQLGDTLTISNNWRDQQHNAGFGRMIAYDPTADKVTFIWTDHRAATGDRYMKYSSVTFEEDTPVVGDIITVGVAGAGYGALALDAEGAARIALHQNLNTGVLGAGLATRNEFIPTMFDVWAIPSYTDDIASIWPQIDVAEYNGETYAHVITNGRDEPNDQKFFYHRARWIGGSGLWENSTPNGATQELISDKSMTLSTVIKANNTGDKVAVASTLSRWLLGEGPADWDGKRASQADNDVYLWTSEDGGETWDWEAPLNVTNFADPDFDLMPDTIAASKDTLRAYSEVDVMWDNDDVIHLGFHIHPFIYYEVEGSGAVSVTSRMFHWDSESQLFSQIVDGTFFNGAQPAAWEQMVSHVNLYKDESTGILWASWAQYGEPEGYEITDDDILIIYDASDSGEANCDIYVAASPDNGLRWTKGVNITNTNTTESELLPGDSRSERDPSLAFNNDGDYLNLFYTLDFDAGISNVAGQEEGDATDNQMVYHRVAKQELMDIFEENGEWVRNYPVHINGDNYYEDENDWAWSGFWDGGVEDGKALAPDQFELNQNYPNPFNPSTSVNFTLQSIGAVKLAVYDVLGREVAVLVNRTLNAGAHNITFQADELPSGVYFAKLTSGNASKVRKMILMK